MNIVKDMAQRFRNAIEDAKEDGCFVGDMTFWQFPYECCGDASYLLAEYLMEHDIDSIWYSANKGDCSHAWLVIDDDNVEPQVCSQISYPESIRNLLSLYSGRNVNATENNIRYVEECFVNCNIVDITGDQFRDYDIPVYYGRMDYFHRSWEFIDAYDFEGLESICRRTDDRLKKLYSIALRYMNKIH